MIKIFSFLKIKSRPLITSLCIGQFVLCSSVLAIAEQATQQNGIKPIAVTLSNNTIDIPSLSALGEKDDIASQVALADAYFKGTLVPRDEQKAYYWYQKAANLGSARAQFYMAYFSKTGKFFEQNYPAAFGWYLKSAEQGYVDAQYFVGYYYEKGRGIKQDFKRSFYWYARAANQGDGVSQYRLGYDYYKGVGTPKDIMKSYFWTLLAVKNDIGGALSLKQQIEKSLSPDDIQVAEQQANTWKPVAEK